ncbi:unnamed protein product [Arctogadus glacialis]
MFCDNKAASKRLGRWSSTAYGFYIGSNSVSSLHTSVWYNTELYVHNQRFIIIFIPCTKKCVSSLQNATSSVLLAVFCYYFLLEKEGWAAERSRSETCCFGLAFERA